MPPTGTWRTLQIETRTRQLAVVTLNRPDTLNALNRETLTELEQAFRELMDDDAVQAVIVTGAGEKAFAAGADITELSGLNQTEGRALSRWVQQIFAEIERAPKPVVAAINGYALGGGAELALACHLRIAADHAQIGLPEVTLGLIPGFGGTQRLARLTGRGVALEMILTGEPIDATRAERTGIVNRVVPRDQLMEEAERVALRMIRNGPLALSYAIRAVNGLTSEDEGYALEAGLFGELCETEDFQEGTSAFLEKREPQFRGR